MNSKRKQESTSTSVHKCDLCLKSFYNNNKNTLHHLSDKFISQILQIINIRHWIDEQTGIKSVISCEPCKLRLDSLLNTLSQLENIKITLCNLKEIIAKQMILGPLGMSEVQWKEWEIQKIYDRDYNSCNYCNPQIFDPNVQPSEEGDSNQDFKLTKVTLILIMKISCFEIKYPIIYILHLFN